MHTLCCQIQIDRLGTLTEDRVITLCRNLSEQIPNVTFESGDDNGRYVNLFIDADDAADAWSLITTSLLLIESSELRCAQLRLLRLQGGMAGTTTFCFIISTKHRR